MQTNPYDYSDIHADFLDSIDDSKNMVDYASDCESTIDGLIDLNNYTDELKNAEEVKPVDAESLEEPKKDLSPEEKKERFKEYLLNMQEFEFFQKHGFMMDGKAKRRLKKIISKNVDSGRTKMPEDVDLNNLV